MIDYIDYFTWLADGGWIRVSFTWIPINELTEIELWPSIVRDCVIDGTYQSVDQLINRENDW